MVMSVAVQQLQNDLRTQKKKNSFCGNNSAPYLAKTDAYHGRSKHIDLRDNFLHEKVNSGNTTLQYKCSETMAADSFTKPVTKENH